MRHEAHASSWEEEMMSEATFDSRDYRGTGPENYDRYFVPVLGAPLATDLVQAASLQPGERVLDVACGTGVVTKLAVESVGDGGQITGLDVNPGMLAIARATTSGPPNIEWYEASAEAMPLPNGSFDVVLCQMGLQFVTDKLRALREAKRVLAPEGRLVINMPGPTPPLMAAFADSLAQHIDPMAAGFVNAVFSLHDPDALRAMITGAGFTQVTIDRTQKRLPLPEAEAFLWQYVHSTPLGGPVGQATDEQRAALAADIFQRWQPFIVDGTLTMDVSMTTVHAS